MKLLLLALCLCAALSACSTLPTSVPTHKYYILDDMPEAVDNNFASVVSINRITVPDYLNQRKLVLRQLDQQIIFANLHSWADDLPMSIERVLTRELNRNTELFQLAEGCDNCKELLVNIDHFYPTDSGTAVLAGSYLLVQTQQEKQPRKYFSFERDLMTDGYDEAVKQMRKLLQQLSNDIKRTIFRNNNGN